MKIIITGDLVITDKNYSGEFISEELINHFMGADLKITNLEAPIINDDINNKIVKTGPHIKADKCSSENVLKLLNINLVTLANNHIMDYGRKGAEDTIKFLNELKIRYVGYGKNAIYASDPYIYKKNGVRIAIVNVTENEWANAEDNNPGANSLDIIENTKSINVLKNNSDIIILIIHGGNEQFEYPSPRMVKQYRYFAEIGVSAIIGHHSHVISGYEVYKGVPIFYGLGNFIFTVKSRFNNFYEGLLLELVIDDNIKNVKEFNIKPIELTKEKHELSFQSIEKIEYTYKKIYRINSAIVDNEQLLFHWNKFVEKKTNQYLKVLSPISGIKNRYIRGILYLTKIHKLFFSNEYIKELFNIIRCESHRDMVVEVLKKKLKKSEVVS